MVSGYEEFIKSYKSNFPERYGKTKINVMVLGPKSESPSPSAQLREFIIRQCREHVTAIKGEHKQLIRTFQRTVRVHHSLCSMEIDVAKNEVDAVIIIPDSAGSFVELGLFCIIDDICSKTLVLFNDKYKPREGKSSFMHLGPKLAYESRNAIVDFVDYSDKKSVWEKVDNFLLHFRALKYDQSLMGSS